MRLGAGYEVGSQETVWLFPAFCLRAGKFCCEAGKIDIVKMDLCEQVMLLAAVCWFRAIGTVRVGGSVMAGLVRLVPFLGLGGVGMSVNGSCESALV